VVEPTSTAMPNILSWKPGQIATSTYPPPATREFTAQVIFHSPFFSAP
jgi:hypothetical protein